MVSKMANIRCIQIIWLKYILKNLCWGKSQYFIVDFFYAKFDPDYVWDCLTYCKWKQLWYEVIYVLLSFILSCCFKRHLRWMIDRDSAFTRQPTPGKIHDKRNDLKLYFLLFRPCFGLNKRTLLEYLKKCFGMALDVTFSIYNLHSFFKRHFCISLYK